MKKYYVIGICLVLILLTGCGTKKEEKKQLVFSLKSMMLKCPSPTLYVYDNNTYEYYYTYSTNDQELIPKTGSYNYDLYSITSNLSKYVAEEYGDYEYRDKNNKVYSLTNSFKQLNEFLKSIDVRIHVCA